MDNGAMKTSERLPSESVIRDEMPKGKRPVARKSKRKGRKSSRY